MKRLGLLVAASMLVLAACGDGDDSSSGEDDRKPGFVQGSTEADEAGATEEYFEAITSGDVDDLSRAMEELAAPDSVAFYYASYHRGTSQAYSDSGYPSTEARLSEDDGSFESCQDTIEGDESCVIFDDIKMKDGKVSSFTIDGVDISSQLAVGSDEPIYASNLVDVRLVAAYKSVESGALFVVMDVNSKSAAVEMYGFNSTYRSPDGRQKTALDYAGPTTLNPDSLATYVVAFESADFGGLASVEFSNAETYDTETVTIDLATVTN